MAGFSGVMLTIGVTLGGYWKSLSPAEFLEWFANNNQFVSNAIPLIVLPTIIGLVGSVWMSWTVATVRLLWLTSGLLILIVLIMTVVYFVPTNTAFATSGIEAASVTAKLNQWIMIHYVRISLAMVGAVLGIIATVRHAALST